MTLATRAAESVELGVGALHQIADGVDHLEEEGLLLAEEAAMADAAAKDFAQDVAAAFVGGQDAVVDEEGGGAGVVGDDAQAGVGGEGSIPSGAKAPASFSSASARLKSCPDTRPAQACAWACEPVSSAARAMSGVNRSVSKLETLPCSTAATRSRPMPVSMEGLGAG